MISTRIPLPCLLAILFTGAASLVSAQTPTYPGAMEGGLGSAPTRTVSQDELDRYLVVLDAMVETGLDAEKELGVNPSDPAASAAAVRYSERVRGLVQSNGFDETSFSAVHQNLMRAYMAAAMADHEDEIAAARAEQQAAMAKMRESMSPEQAEAMMRAMGDATAMMDSVSAGVPKENVALVEKNRARFDAIFEKGQKSGRK